MKTKIDSQAVYVAVIPFSGDLAGVPVVFNPGQRVKGSDPAVSAYPDMFAKESDLDEIQIKRRAAWEPAFSLVRIEDTTAPKVVSQKLRVKRDVELLIDGNRRLIRKGDLLETNDVVKTLVPDAVEPVEV